MEGAVSLRRNERGAATDASPQSRDWGAQEGVDANELTAVSRLPDLLC